MNEVIFFMNVIVLDAHTPNDGRIQRHIKYLLENDINVYHLNFNLYNRSLSEGFYDHVGEKAFRINMFRRGDGKFWFIHHMSQLLRHKISHDSIEALKSMGLDTSQKTIIHVHDPCLLHLAGSMSKKWLSGSKVVYDRHEVYEMLPSFLDVNSYTLFENIGISHISGLILVSDYHLEGARRLFPAPHITVIPNYPSSKDYDDCLIESKIESFAGHIDLVYIGGLASSIDRDVDLLMKICERVLQCTDNTRFIIGGRAADDELKERFVRYEKMFPDRFLFLGEVTRSDVIRITENAHIGFFLIRPDAKYWVKASPNKVYEYLICGTVPVVRADIENAEKIIESALIFNRDSEDDDVVDGVLSLVEDNSQLQRMMRSSRNVSKMLCSDSVDHRYIALYKALMNDNACNIKPALLIGKQINCQID